MIRAAVLLLLFSLPGCVAAIGNTGYGEFGSWPKSTIPLLQERVDAARRIVELREQQLATLQSSMAAGRSEGSSVLEAQIEVEHAKLLLLQCRAELSAAEARQREEDDEH